MGASRPHAWVHPGPVPSRARTAPELHLTPVNLHPLRVPGCSLGAGKVQLYRAWVRLGEFAVLRVSDSEIIKVEGCGCDAVLHILEAHCN